MVNQLTLHVRNLLFKNVHNLSTTSISPEHLLGKKQGFFCKHAKFSNRSSIAGEPAQFASEKPVIRECPQFEYNKPFPGAPFRYVRILMITSQFKGLELGQLGFNGVWIMI